MKMNEFNFTDRKCSTCNPDTPPIEGEKLHRYFNELSDGWTLVDDHQLEKSWRFKNFRQALDFTVKIGEMSEVEGHHPEILLTWGKVKVIVFTHAIDALSENDFIWAAKVDKLLEESR